MSDTKKETTATDIIATELSDEALENVDGGITLDNGIKRSAWFATKYTGNDTIIGVSVNDTIIGVSGNDTLFAGFSGDKTFKR